MITEFKTIRLEQFSSKLVKQKKFNKNGVKIPLNELNYIQNNILKIQVPPNSILQNIRIRVKLESSFNRQIIYKTQEESCQNSQKVSQNNINHNETEQRIFFIIQLAQIQCIIKLRDQLLNKSQKLSQIISLAELQGILLQLSKQNMGSRIIQKLLSKRPQENKFIYQQLHPYFSQLIKDQYGNYVMQKIIQNCSEEQIIEVLASIKTQIIQIIKTKQGTHFFQLILHKIKNKQTLFQHIKQFQVQLCLNQFGTHFMQKMLKICCNNQVFELYTQKNTFLELAKNKYGVVCLKSLLSVVCPYYLQNQNRTNILNIIFQFKQELIQDKYAHYLLQELFYYYFEQQMAWLLYFISHCPKTYTKNQYVVSIITIGLSVYKYKWSYPLIQMIQQNESLAVDLMSNKIGSFMIHRLLDQSYYIRDNFVNFLNSKLKCVKNNYQKQKWSKYLSF